MIYRCFLSFKLYFILYYIDYILSYHIKNSNKKIYRNKTKHVVVIYILFIINKYYSKFYLCIIGLV